MLDTKGIGIEAGLASIEDAKKFVESEFPNRVIRVLVEIDRTSDEKLAVKTCSNILALVEDVTSASILCHGFEKSAWVILRWAASRRFDLRIGLEDTLRLPNDEIAQDNSALVREARKVMKAQRVGAKSDR